MCLSVSVCSCIYTPDTVQFVSLVAEDESGFSTVLCVGTSWRRQANTRS